jgi:catechol 2,3-dioxygenase-like lactoylglutathione lyase family enzyme
MLDHIILTVSDVERSLKFYTAALKPLKVKMFLPYKGADGHPDLWGFGDGRNSIEIVPRDIFVVGDEAAMWERTRVADQRSSA